MKNRRHITAVLCAVVLLALVSWPRTSHAQEREIKRTWGVSTYLQTTPINVVIPVWLTQQVVLAPLVNFSYLENSATIIGGGFALRIYPVMQRVAPYWGVRVQAATTIPSGNGSSVTGYAGGIYFGGEFFINSKFSFGVEPGIYITVPPRSGPINVATTTFLVATAHF